MIFIIKFALALGRTKRQRADDREKHRNAGTMQNRNAPGMERFFIKGNKELTAMFPKLKKTV